MNFGIFVECVDKFGLVLVEWVQYKNKNISFTI